LNTSIGGGKETIGRRDRRGVNKKKRISQSGRGKKKVCKTSLKRFSTDDNDRGFTNINMEGKITMETEEEYEGGEESGGVKHFPL